MVPTSEIGIWHFWKIVEDAPDGVQIIGLDGRAMYSNKAVKKMFGYIPDELAGLLNEERPASLMSDLIESGRWSGELQVRHKEGRVFPLLLNALLVKGADGEAVAAVVFLKDVTRQKWAEEELKRHQVDLENAVDERTAELTAAVSLLKQEIAERKRLEEELIRADKLESIGLLAGGIAHDFNNILTAILNNLSLAHMYADRKDLLLKNLAVVERAALRAQALTRQLLTFSMGGAPVRKTASLSELVEDAVGFSLKSAKVRCDTDMPEDLWAVEVDDTQIGQVLNNLIINAEQAMPESGIITVKADNIVVGNGHGLPIKGGRYVRLSIIDRGVGIPDEHLPKIFDPFFTTKQRGSGLGLATSYSIIKKHDGHISVESRVGEGAAFHVYLPASERAFHRTSPARERIASFGLGSVLVMDDEPDIRESLGDILMLFGYRAEFAADGEEAVGLFKRAKDEERPFDAVIMDIKIHGGMGGMETIKLLREIAPDVKAIASSGYSKDPVVQQYRQYGFCGYLGKPYLIEDLMRVLEETIKKST